MAKKPTKKTVADKRQMGLFDAIMKSEAARAEVKAMLDFKRLSSGRGEDWRGVVAMPPASLVETVVKEFRDKTDIPLELPFFTVLHWVAAYLLRNEIGVNVGSGQVVKPDLWTVLLASSGTGKTLTQKAVSKALGLGELEFKGNGCASSAAFLEKLEKNNKGIWVRDEFGQFLKALGSQSHMEEIKDYLLRIHDNETIERETKKYTCTVEDSALTILGLTVWETFPRHVSAEDMVDGFAQRFSYIVAEKDPKRPMINYPIYQIDSASWRQKWDTLVGKIEFDEYRASEDAIEGYKTAFAMMYSASVPESFYRRLLWRAHKYALVYHIMTGQGDRQEITAMDYGWAGRVLSLHVHDAMRLLEAHGLSDLEKLLRSAESVIEKVRGDEGRQATARDLCRGVFGIKSAAEARAILSLIENG